MVIRIAQGALYLSLASMASASTPETISAPQGLKLCSPGDPVATVEARVATRLGGDFLGCYHSDQTSAVANSVPQGSTPAEYAFALALHDREYTITDLRELLTKVKQQWKEFNPVGGKLSDAYVAKLNELTQEQHEAGNTGLKSIRPTLVKIDQDHDRYYTVISIRTYVVTNGAASRTVIKVNADAVVLRDSRLVRLTIQRTLTVPADVSRTQAEIDRWARSVV